MQDEEEGRTNSRWDNVARGAITEGLREVLENHPSWASYADAIGSHIDGRKFDEEKQRILAETNEAAKNGKFASEDLMWGHVYEQLVYSVASGRVFDDFAMKAVLNKGLEDRISDGFFVGGARPEQEKMTKLDEIISANNKVYEMMKSGDYAKRMPELAEAVITIRDAGMLNAAIDILDYHKLIDGGKYYAIKTAIEKRAIDAYDTTVTNIEKYVSSASKEKEGETQVTDITKKTKQKIAASIIGILGLGILIAAKTAVTGGVIGSLPSSSRFIGTGLLVVSLIWMWAAFKRK